MPDTAPLQQPAPLHRDCTLALYSALYTVQIVQKYSSSTRQTNSLSPLSHIINRILVKVTVTESKIVTLVEKKRDFDLSVS